MTLSSIVRPLASSVAGLFVFVGLLRDPLVADHPARGVDWYLAKTRVVVRAERPIPVTEAPQATVERTVSPSVVRE